MPRIPDILLECAVYIFPTKEAAHAGERTSGATGFVAGVRHATQPDVLHGYIVTNAHSVEKRILAGQPIAVRVNLVGGGFDVVVTEASSWVLHPDGEDVAVCPIDDPNKQFAIAVISTDRFITREWVEKASIGPGDDVFMIGRFVGHQGDKQNSPSVRFGNIAQMPALIRQKVRGHNQLSWLVEMRSSGGFSGSPVFLLTLATIPGVNAWPRFSRPDPMQDIRQPYFLGPWLLGVNWGHFGVRGRMIHRHDGSELVSDDVPEIDSAMAQVVPSWILLDLLDQPNFVAQRTRSEETDSRQHSYGAVLDALDVANGSAVEKRAGEVAAQTNCQ